MPQLLVSLAEARVRPPSLGLLVASSLCAIGVALVGLALAGCGAGGDDDPPASPDAAELDPPDAGGVLCSTPSDCERAEDCRCAGGSIRGGSACDDGVCATRAEVCDAVCADAGGWRPNPEGCHDWQLIEDPGTTPDYQNPGGDGCLSGARILTGRPAPWDDEYLWCVPTEPCPSGTCVTQCEGDADCPADWTCNPPVTNAQSGNDLRLCNPPLGDQTAPFCDLG